MLSLRILTTSLLFALFLLLTGCGGDGLDLTQLDGPPNQPKKIFNKKFAEAQRISQHTALLLHLQQKMPPVRPGEWRSFWHEKEQSPADYAASFPVCIDNQRNTLYLRRVGYFSKRDEQLFDLIKSFLAIYFQCPVQTAPDITIERFTKSALKKERNGEISLNSIFLTDHILKPELPANGWGVLGIATNNIYKSDGLSNQYGDSLLFGRAGVISLYHLNTPDNKLYIMRALKGAAHEATHLLSIPHCSTWLCLINGSADLREFDRAPLHLDHECLAKLLIATKADPAKRFNELENFARQNYLSQKYITYCQNASNLFTPLQ